MEEIPLSIDVSTFGDALNTPSPLSIAFSNVNDVFDCCGMALSEETHLKRCANGAAIHFDQASGRMKQCDQFQTNDPLTHALFYHRDSPRGQ